MFSDRELKIIYRDFKCNKGRNFLTFREKKKKRKRRVIQSFPHLLFSPSLMLACIPYRYTRVHSLPQITAIFTPTLHPFSLHTSTLFQLNLL